MICQSPHFPFSQILSLSLSILFLTFYFFIHSSLLTTSSLLLLSRSLLTSVWVSELMVCPHFPFSQILFLFSSLLSTSSSTPHSVHPPLPTLSFLSPSLLTSVWVSELMGCLSGQFPSQQIYPQSVLNRSLQTPPLFPLIYYILFHLLAPSISPLFPGRVRVFHFSTGLVTVLKL